MSVCNYAWLLQTRELPVYFLQPQVVDCQQLVELEMDMGKNYMGNYFDDIIGKHYHKANYRVQMEPVGQREYSFPRSGDDSFLRNDKLKSKILEYKDLLSKYLELKVTCPNYVWVIKIMVSFFNILDYVLFLIDRWWDTIVFHYAKSHMSTTNNLSELLSWASSSCHIAHLESKVCHHFVFLSWFLKLCQGFEIWSLFNFFGIV